MNQQLFEYFKQEHGIMLLESDLQEIKNILQPEVQTIAIEFAEWNETKNPYLYWENENMWRSFNKLHEPITTSELFAKFMAERQPQ